MQSCSPTRFRVGDIVEVQLSLVIFPTKRDKFKMALILRGIAILDSMEIEVSYILIQYAIIQVLTIYIQRGTSARSLPAAITLKRKVGYDEDNEEEITRARKRLNNLTLSNQSGDSPKA